MKQVSPEKGLESTLLELSSISMPHSLMLLSMKCCLASLRLVKLLNSIWLPVF